MEKDRITREVMILTICFLLIGITIGYTALNSTLHIRGTAKVNNPGWQVRFKSGSIISPTMSNNGLVGSAIAPLVNPTFTESNMTFSGDFGTMSDSQDQIKWYFDVENSGSIDAEYSNLILGEVSCTPAVGSSVTLEQAELYCSEFDFELTDSEGEAINCGKDLPVNGSHHFLLTLSYDNDNTVTMPLQDSIAVTISSSSLVYTQDGTTICE